MNDFYWGFGNILLNVADQKKLLYKWNKHWFDLKSHIGRLGGTSASDPMDVASNPDRASVHINVRLKTS